MITVKGKLVWLLGGTGLLVLLASSIHPSAQAQSQIPKAKLTPWAAMNVANERVHGKPISATYELDEGHWLYDVMIAKGNKLNVVEVDANTGKADKPEASTPEEEAKELVSDLNKALGKSPGSATVQGSGEKAEKGEKPD
jgi:hypothetical protein